MSLNYTDSFDTKPNRESDYLCIRKGIFEVCPFTRINNQIFLHNQKPHLLMFWKKTVLKFMCSNTFKLSLGSSSFWIKLMAPQFFPENWQQFQNVIQIGINGSRLLSKNKIAVPESGVYILELFMNGRQEAVHFLQQCGRLLTS